ncbi:hypothetical protein MASR1M45_05980 [Candidatus Kapaibacterium sp.]
MLDGPEKLNQLIESETTREDNNSNLTEEQSILADRLFAIERELFEKLQKPIMRPEPLLTILDVPVLYPKSLALVQGKKGAGKSMFVEALVSSLIKDDKVNDSIGSKRHDDRDNLLVLYIDSERGAGFIFGVKKMLVLAGHDSFSNVNTLNTEDYFRYIDIAGLYPPEDRTKYIEAYLSRLRELYPEKNIIVIVDILTDLGADYMKGDESTKLMQYFNYLVSQHDFAFILVVHENPTGLVKKARGFIGTESLNKSVTSFSFEALENGVFVLENLHQRYAKRGKKIHYTYDEATYSIKLASEDQIAELQPDTTKKLTTTDVVNSIATITNLRQPLDITKPIPQKDLISELTKVHSVSKDTVKDRISTIIDEKYFIKITGFQYLLTQEKQGRSTVYVLVMDNTTIKDKADDSKDDDFSF